MRNPESVLSTEVKNHTLSKMEVVACLVAGTLLLAGCTEASANKPAGTTSAATLEATPAYSSPPSPIPSISEPVKYPAGPKGCVDNKNWTKSETGTWLNGLITNDATTGNYTLSAAEDVYRGGGKLCEAIKVKAVFWMLEGAFPINMYEGEENEISFDGSKTIEIQNNRPQKRPDNAPIPGASSCNGSARALYLDWDDLKLGIDLPQNVEIRNGTASIITEVEFAPMSDRVIEAGLGCTDTTGGYGLPSYDPVRPGYGY